MRTLLGLMALAFLVGCDTSSMSFDPVNGADMKPDMMNRGIIYILPGIQGVDYHYFNIRKGLRGAGIKCAIKIHPWGCQIPGINLAINETDTRDDRGWGKKIATEIAEYQRKYPGRPVYLLGQSGGSAVSVFTAESLAAIGAQPVSGIVLLDASIGSNYNLSTALSKVQKGMVNFYNLADVALLEVGTEIFGNLDGSHGASAGRTGFYEQYPKLYQVKILKDMVSQFADPHFADTSSAFATHFIAPWILARTWPPLVAAPLHPTGGMSTRVE